MSKIAITGAAGRMGQRLIALARQGGDEIVAAIESDKSAALGRDAGEVAGIGRIGLDVTSDFSAPADVLIDFSSPAGTRRWLDVCKRQRIPMVIGTTGLSQSDHAEIDDAAKMIAVLQSPNMSLGVNLLMQIAGDVAKRLGDDYDIEIVEGHHRFKKDAPSGTAMGLANSILHATGKDASSLRYDRHGDDVTRQRGEIGLHSLRIGDEIGRHTIYFASLGERLELTHVATNRDTFAQGALRGAHWLIGQAPGRYTLKNVLNL